MRIMLLLAIFMISHSAVAGSDYSKHCPSIGAINQIGSVISMYLKAKNSDNKEFMSRRFQICNYCDYDKYVPINFRDDLTQYSFPEKKLSCYYEGRYEDSKGNGQNSPLHALVNFGDY